MASEVFEAAEVSEVPGVRSETASLTVWAVLGRAEAGAESAVLTEAESAKMLKKSSTKEIAEVVNFLNTLIDLMIIAQNA